MYSDELSRALNSDCCADKVCWWNSSYRFLPLRLGPALRVVKDTVDALLKFVFNEFVCRACSVKGGGLSFLAVLGLGALGVLDELEVVEPLERADEGIGPRSGRLEMLELLEVSDVAGGGSLNESPPVC